MTSLVLGSIPLVWYLIGGVVLYLTADRLGWIGKASSRGGGDIDPAALLSLLKQLSARKDAAALPCCPHPDCPGRAKPDPIVDALLPLVADKAK